MKLIGLFAGIGGLLTQTAQAGVTLATDFTDSNGQLAPLHNFWSVRNEIPGYPNPGPQQPAKTNKMNCVRLLGGWASNGLMDLSEDVVTWDATTQTYVYHWDMLTDRIDGVRSQGREIHQLVLDNPPWCFQRGLTFTDDPGGGEYNPAYKVTTYGNSLPPGDPVAWNTFIKAMMNKLVQVYGSELVDTWRFRIATEADYKPHHWAGSKQDFFDHYRNTAEAVRSVLPNAKLAAHFLGAGGNGRYGAEFVRWCYQNNVPYDFIGVSIYPFYNNSRQVDLERVWDEDFKPFVNQSQWNPNAKMEIPEYALFTEKDDDGFNMGVGTSHDDSFGVMLAKMVYDNNMSQIHRWGEHMNDPTVLALDSMVGHDRFVSQKSGNPNDTDNKIDGIFAADAARTTLDALIYNYNSDPAYIADEAVSLSFTVPFPPGSQYEYRIAVCDRGNNPQYQFVQNHPEAGLWESQGGWVIDRIKPDSTSQTDKNGLFDQILISTGKNLWNAEKASLAGYQRLEWSTWQNIATTTGAGTGKSKLTLTVPLSSFSFQKIEFRQRTIPLPWISSDVGSTATGGNATGNATAFTLQGSGNDVWTTADEFQFMYQTVTGDCEIKARVLSVENTNVWAKAGVMIRETTGAASKNSALLVTPGNGITFQQRTATGGSTISDRVAGLTAPYWVKLRRTGNIFTGFRSADGVNWSAYPAQTIAMGESVQIGLAVTSHSDGTLCEATFDNVIISKLTAHAGPDQFLMDTDGDGASSVILDASGSIPGNSPIVSYVWNEGPTQIATGLNPTISLNLGVHNLSLTITDSSGQMTNDSVVITIEPFASILVAAVNAGGSAYTASDGTVYQADNGFSAGTETTSSVVISNTLDGPLYQTSRYGDFAWAQTLPNGSYSLALKFSENWTNAGPGARVFSVDVEGVERIASLDLFNTVGKFSAYDLTLPITVTDGELNILFSSDANNAVIGAILVKTAAAQAMVTTADAGPDQNFVGTSGSTSVILNGSASFSPDAAITSYLWTENGLQIAAGPLPTVSLSAGVHTIILTVTDGRGASASDTIIIAVATTIFGDLADASPISNGSIGNTANDLTFFSGRAGASPGVNRSPVLVFRLPDVGAIANPFRSASLEVNLASYSGVPTANVDLYGLARISTNTSVVTGDYFGDGTPDASATLLQASILTPATPVGPITTSAAANSSLTDFLNAKYASGAGASKVVFLRLSNDAAMGNNLRYNFTSANGAAAANGGAGETSIWPRLTYTVNINSPPTITGLSDLEIAVNSVTAAIQFTISDNDSTASSLTVTAETSDQTLVPPASIDLGGSGGTRTVTITPAPNLLGSSTISLIVSDGTLTTSETFVLTVIGSGIETWRFANFGTTANIGNAADDFDGNADGESNLLEFATGQAPDAATLMSTPLITNGPNLEFIYTRSLAALNDGVIFSVIWSDSLASGSWSSAGVAEEPLTDNGRVQDIKATLPVGSSSKRFVRLITVAP